MTDRDFANRSVLPKKLAALRAEMKVKFPDGEPWKDSEHYGGYASGNLHEHNDAWDEWQDLQGRVDGTVALQKRIGMDAQPTYYLIGFQPDVGHGRAIVSRGNPDLAKDVSTLVPGTYSKLARMDGDVERSNRMMSAAKIQGADPSNTAAITWCGYDAPQSIPGDASQMSFAENGAPLLRSFMTGLRTTHEGAASHTTLISHSYGTTLAGKTASGGLDVNDMVFVAGPGIGVGSGWSSTGSVEDLHLDQESATHVYATRSKSDPIHWTDDTALGIDPYNVNFDGNLFGADPGGGHSDYWNSYDNPSLIGIGQVIAGHGDDVAAPTADQMPARTTQRKDDLTPYLAP